MTNKKFKPSDFEKGLKKTYKKAIKCTCNFSEETAAEIGHYKDCPKYEETLKEFQSHFNCKALPSWEERFKEVIVQDIGLNAEIGLYINQLKSFIRQTIKTERAEAVKEENQAWVNGFRCLRCGREKKYDALCDTCDDCLEN